jgi:hypothetical protein
LQKYKERSNLIIALLDTDFSDLNPDDHHFARHEPPSVDNGSTAPHSVNCVPQNVGESMELCYKIEDDLMARNLDTVGDLGGFHAMLVERLEIEYNLKELQQ